MKAAAHKGRRRLAGGRYSSVRSNSEDRARTFESRVGVARKDMPPIGELNGHLDEGKRAGKLIGQVKDHWLSPRDAGDEGSQGE